MSRQWLRMRAVVAALGILAVLSADLPLRGISREVQIPSPQAAEQQAESMTPSEITQIEVDEVIRDRLRFDPQWQPILQAVREDILVLKWGDSKLANPVWKRYGAKAYPLLEYYSRSRDELRQSYGIAGILSLGKPYTTLWLTKQIQRRAQDNSFSLITSKPEALLNRNSYDFEEPKVWQQRLGLDDSQTRTRLIQLAKANLEPSNSPSYYGQFNLAFLEALTTRPSYYNERDKPAPNISSWLKFERIAKPTSAQIQTAIAQYNKLPKATQDYILVSHLGKVKAGQISVMGKALLDYMATTPNHSERVWAIAELDRHGDKRGAEWLQNILNTDFRQLYSITRYVFYGWGGDLDRETHAYYLLVGMAQKYPQSRFIKSCREYGNLTGRSYFGGEPRDQKILDQIRRKSPAQHTKDWQTWLANYPDHPGADDAMDFLARSLQAQNDVVGAMRIWLKLMQNPVGDGDARYLAYPHVRTLLDVGLSIEQLQTLLSDPANASISPLLQYAVAVKYARSQDYAKALQTSEKLDLAILPAAILDTYYNANWSWWDDTKTADVQKGMQTILTEQRQRWRQLLTWQQENTSESRYQIASNWAGAGGWKNGYLPMWDGWRVNYLPTTYSTSKRYPVEPNDRWDCRYWWVCDLSKRGDATVRSTYQSASQNAVAISLYQQLLNDPKTPNSIREKTLYMIAMTLLWQWENHDTGETSRIHPPAGVPMGRTKTDQYTGEVLPNIESAYQSRIDGILTELQVKFPKSAYIDDLLFSSYFLSGKPSYLKQLADRYPNSDRALEARFLLKYPASYRPDY